MSYNAMSWASKQEVPDCESKLLLMILSEHANPHETHDPEIYTCWPGIARLSKECLLSETTVKDRLRVLEQSGLIRITERKDEDGRNRSNLYTLMVAPEFQWSAGRGVGVAARGEGGRPAPPRGSPHDPEPVIGTSNKKKVRTHHDRGDLVEVVDFCKSIDLPPEDGFWFFNKCEGNGWTNNGKPIKDWMATIRAWKAAGYMASQKQSRTKSGKFSAYDAVQQILKGTT